MNLVKILAVLVISIIVGGVYGWVGNQYSDYIPIYPFIAAMIIYYAIKLILKNTGKAAMLALLFGFVAYVSLIVVGFESVKNEIRNEMAQDFGVSADDPELKQLAGEFIDGYLVEVTGYKGYVGYIVSLTANTVTTRGGNTYDSGEPSFIGTVFQGGKFFLVVFLPLIMCLRDRKKEKSEQATENNEPPLESAT